MAQGLIVGLSVVWVIIVLVVGMKLAYQDGYKNAMDTIDWTLERSNRQLADPPVEVPHDDSLHIPPEYLMAHGIYEGDDPMKWEPEKSMDEILGERGVRR